MFCAMFLWECSSGNVPLPCQFHLQSWGVTTISHWKLGNPREQIWASFCCSHPCLGTQTCPSTRGLLALEQTWTEDSAHPNASRRWVPAGLCLITHMLGCPANPECPFCPQFLSPALAWHRVWFCVQNDSLWHRSELSQMKTLSLKSSVITSVFSVGSTFASLHLFDFSVLQNGNANQIWRFFPFFFFPKLLLN